MNVGLVGLGGMGTVHYHNYLHIPDARVAAVVGTADADRARAAEWGVPIYESIQRMVESQTIDLVDICTPTYLHKQLTLQSLALGKPTITEKPVALTLDDALEMYAAADRAGVPLYVAQVMQFSKEIQTLRQAVREEWYGKPLDASFTRLSARPQWTQGNWLLDKAKSGLVPFDLHIHDLDVMVSLFGKPLDLRYVSCGGEGRPYREHYRFDYAFKGLHANAEAAWLNAAIPFTVGWRVYFERGMLIRDDRGLSGYDEHGRNTYYNIEDEVKIPTGINIAPTGWFLRELSHFLDCARRGEPSPLVPREQVLTVLETLQQID